MIRHIYTGSKQYFLMIKLTLGFLAFLANLDDDARIGDQYDGQGQEVEEADAEDSVDHQSSWSGVEEPKRYALMKVWIQRMALHVEDDALSEEKKLSSSVLHVVLIIVLKLVIIDGYQFRKGLIKPNRVNRRQFFQMII